MTNAKIYLIPKQMEGGSVVMNYKIRCAFLGRPDNINIALDACVATSVENLSRVFLYNSAYCKLECVSSCSSHHRWALNECI